MGKQSVRESMRDLREKAGDGYGRSLLALRQAVENVIEGGFLAGEDIQKIRADMEGAISAGMEAGSASVREKKAKLSRAMMRDMGY